MRISDCFLKASYVHMNTSEIVYSILLVHVHFQPCNDLVIKVRDLYFNLLGRLSIPNDLIPT